MKLEVFDDKQGVAEAAADLLERTTGHVVLSGGSTPKAAYGLAGARRTDWADTTLWLGDERYVPIDDERSNAGMARAELGEDAPLELVDTSLELDAAAADYEHRLRAALDGRAGVDLALMGLGPDGHTASLFPGKPAVDERTRWVTGVPEAGLEPFVPRITMTLAVWAEARRLVFLVAGEDKAEAMLRAFGDPPDASAPSAHARPQSGELLVLADRAAAARL